MTEPIAPTRHRQPASRLAVVGAMALLFGLVGLANEHLHPVEATAAVAEASAQPAERTATPTETTRAPRDGQVAEPRDAASAASTDEGGGGEEGGAEDAGPSDEPALADPNRVVIPAIAVDVALTEVGLQDDGAMELPDFGYAAWYTEGPRPGEVGPAVIVGHLDDRRGPDVFHELEQLVPGDEIQVTRTDGTRATFVVEDMELMRKEALPVERIWGDTEEPTLRLITCGGSFDRTTGHYESNLIVYAAAA